MKKKRILFALAAIVTLCILVGVGVAYHTKTLIHDIFRLNQLRKSQGYYLSEFEWEMLAAAHYLDAGRFVRSLAILEGVHDKLAHPESLIQAPESADSLERLEFYLSLQNPDTGAFIRDDALPLFTYIGPTANMISLVEELSAEVGRPFELKYRLSFLDEINTPESLIALLHEASHVGWIGAKFKTPFVCIAELGALSAMCERLELYTFTPEWKKALYDWFYENQDPETGLWGPRSRSDNRLLHGGSLTESERVIKMFVDRQGNLLHPDYPLRYVDHIIASALAKLADPMPIDLDERHEWILAKDHGTRFITRYLWAYTSPESRAAVQGLMEDFIRLRFDRYYVEQNGAFSLYPDADSADLDGTGEAMGMYGYLGVLDDNIRERLWGPSAETILDFGAKSTIQITENSFDPIRRYPGTHSIRVYASPPGNRLLDNVSLVYYPNDTEVLDAAQLLPGVLEWLDETSQQMGNWVTKDSIRQSLQGIDARPVPTFTEVPVEEVDQLFQDNGQVVLIGFDLLQVPRCMIVYR